mgnify:CR=1 FL=1
MGLRKHVEYFWNCGSFEPEGINTCLHRKPCYNSACKSGLSISDSSDNAASKLNKLKKKNVYIYKVQFEGSIPSIFNPKIKIRGSFDLNRLNMFQPCSQLGADNSSTRITSTMPTKSASPRKKTSRLFDWSDTPQSSQISITYSRVQDFN